MARIIVVRAEHGEVRESRIVDGDFQTVVRDVARRALEEWDPLASDFIVLKDVREIELEAPMGELAELGNIVELEVSEEGVRARFPVVTISFDNRMVSEDKYEEHKVYILAPYVSEELKTVVEAEAAEITSPVEEPGGIRRVG